MPIDGALRKRLEPGTRLEGCYRKEAYSCEVFRRDDEKLGFRLEDGREFKSPSAAGSAVMGGIACNGWRFWSIAGEELPEAPQRTTKRKTTRKPRAKAKKPSTGDSAADLPDEAAGTGTDAA